MNKIYSLIRKGHSTRFCVYETNFRAKTLQKTIKFFSFSRIAALFIGSAFILMRCPFYVKELFSAVNQNFLHNNNFIFEFSAEFEPDRLSGH